MYGPGDLLGTDTFDGGRGGGAARGGASGAGMSGGRAGTGTGGMLSAGSGGKASGGVGASSTGGGGAAAGGSAPKGGSATGGKLTATGGDDAGGAGGGGAGTGGTTATGGSTTGGTGGATTGGAATGGSAPLAPELIDDMEDGNQNILINDNRNGAWYTAAGKDATADPAPMKAFGMSEIVGAPGAAGSTHAMHFTGSGGTEWGAMAAFDFRAAATPKVVYDASAYKGISFWVKAAAAGTIAVRIPIKDTTLAADGACQEMMDGCENHFSAPLPLTTSWKKVTVPWATFMQDPGWGFQTDFAPAELVSVQFVIPSAVAPATAPSADFWIDDISFVP